MLDTFLTSLHPGLTPGATAGLLFLSLLGSFVSAAFGAGGGALLLVGMTLWLPITAAIPLHGVIQLGSNAGRMGVMLRHVQWPLFAAFAGGAVIGVVAGSQLLVELPEGWVEALLGGFILYSLWGRMPLPPRGNRGITVAVGAVTNALTLLVGATGPLVAAYFRTLHLQRLRHVATFSACMMLQHTLKIAAFGALGFAFGDYVVFLAVMIGVGFIGTLLGRATVQRLNDQLFRQILRILLTLLSLRLLINGLAGAL